jgi:SsrA-binding protein
VIIRGAELFLLGAHITPLTAASTHVHADPTRTRKLLLHASETAKLIGKVVRAGYTLVPLNLHWKSGRVKCEVALAKGKAEHDKRDSIKEREGKREVERAMKSRQR